MSIIIIGRPEAEGNTVTNEITVPKKLGRYVKGNFYATYDEEIKCDESIQVIPALSSMLPLAWLSGSDVHVHRLDRTFFNAMNKLQVKYHELYPGALFKTKIVFNELIDNVVGVEGAALNFSGGVDSTYALASIFNLRPRLIMLFRYTHRLEHRSFFNKVSKMYRALARNAGLTFNVVDSNIRDILDFNVMNRNFKRCLGTTVWGSVQQVINQLGVVAPLSVGRFNRLFLASTYSKKQYDLGLSKHGSRPSVDEVVAWADLSVKHEGYINRIDKAKPVVDFMDDTSFKLHVCLKPSAYSRTVIDFDLNCGLCPKCMGTAILLLILGKDPRKYGIPVSNKSWGIFRADIKNADAMYPEIRYRDMQKMVPEHINEDFCGSRKFLERFRSEIDHRHSNEDGMGR